MLDGTRPAAQTDGMSSPYAQKILFFFCRKCGDYHEKTHPHYKAQKQRSYRRRKAKEKSANAVGEGATNHAGAEPGGFHPDHKSQPHL